MGDLPLCLLPTPSLSHQELAPGTHWFGLSCFSTYSVLGEHQQPSNILKAFSIAKSKGHLWGFNLYVFTAYPGHFWSTRPLPQSYMVPISWLPSYSLSLAWCPPNKELCHNSLLNPPSSYRFLSCPLHSALWCPFKSTDPWPSKLHVLPGSLLHSYLTLWTDNLSAIFFWNTCNNKCYPLLTLQY